jgi:lysophospholipase L1-like esterase
VRINQNALMNPWKLLRPPLVAGTVFAGQMARAILRDDLPTLENQDPSGIFGDPDAPPLRLAFLGDSSVTAPGVDPLDHSWPRQMAMHLGASYRVEAISFAVGGSKARNVLREQVDAAIATKPDIAYLAVGSNDALRGTPVARFESDFDEVVGRLYEVVPAIGLSGIGDLGTIPRIPEVARGVARVRARAMDRAIGRVAAKYPHTVKSRVWDIMAIDFAQRPELFADDLFHASAQGHLAFATIGTPMVGRLLEILEERREQNSEALS